MPMPILVQELGRCASMSLQMDENKSVIHEGVAFSRFCGVESW